MPLLIATTNQDKLREIRAVMAGVPVELVALSELPAVPQPDEHGTSYWENAREKALAYARATGLTAVAEDSGLEVAALGGEPGVRSARLLGIDTSYPARFDAIYRRLGKPADRSARFVTALAVATPAGKILFETEATIDGEIAPRPTGVHGFGYDPIFFYAPLNRTTGELTLEEKGAVSHRARAFRNLAAWLRRAGGATP